MTRITNLRPGCIGVDLQPPLKPMRRREQGRFGWFRTDPEETFFTRQRIRRDRNFVLVFIACVVLALLVIVVPLFLTGHGSM